MSAELRAVEARDLRILVIGDGVSTFGSLVARLALPWTAARARPGTLSVGLVFLRSCCPPRWSVCSRGVGRPLVTPTVLIWSNVGLAAATRSCLCWR
jgi:hypothetical protein